MSSWNQLRYFQKLFDQPETEKRGGWAKGDQKLIIRSTASN